MKRFPVKILVYRPVKVVKIHQKDGYTEKGQKQVAYNSKSNLPFSGLHAKLETRRLQ